MNHQVNTTMSVNKPIGETSYVLDKSESRQLMLVQSSCLFISLQLAPYNVAWLET